MAKDDARATILGIALTFFLIGSLFYLWARANLVGNSTSGQTPQNAIILPLIEASAAAHYPTIDQADLKDTRGGNSSGQVFRRVESHLFQAAVTADLPDPPARSFYQAWLGQGSPGDANYTAFSLGQMKRDASGKWFAEYESDKNRGNLWQVYITLEKALDDKPEVMVLFGRLPVKL